VVTDDDSPWLSLASTPGSPPGRRHPSGMNRQGRVSQASPGGLRYPPDG
jgi:hypothetical protein